MLYPIKTHRSRIEVREWRKEVYGRKPKEDMISEAEWQMIRLQVLDRDHYVCQRCDKVFRKQMTVHHIKPRAEGGSNDLLNLVSLCVKCHDYVEMNDLRSMAEIIGSYDDGPIKCDEEEEIISPREETFERPDWHKYVYGGCKRTT